MQNVPVELQKALRSKYPRLEVQEHVSFQLGFGAAAEQELKEPTRVAVYTFAPSDESCEVTVSNDFIAVKTSNYTEWSDFQAHIQATLDAFLPIYEPPTATRVGLRYVNKINLAELDLEMRSPSELFNGDIIGSLSTFGANVTGLASRLNISRGDGSEVALRFKLEGEGKARVYTIDTDVFTNRETPASADVIVSLLTSFNHEIGRAFRWGTSEVVRNALDA